MARLRRSSSIVVRSRSATSSWSAAESGKVRALVDDKGKQDQGSGSIQCRSRSSVCRACPSAGDQAVQVVEKRGTGPRRSRNIVASVKTRRSGRHQCSGQRSRAMFSALEGKAGASNIPLGREGRYAGYRRGDRRGDQQDLHRSDIKVRDRARARASVASPRSDVTLAAASGCTDHRLQRSSRMPRHARSPSARWGRVQIL